MSLIIVENLKSVPLVSFSTTKMHKENILSEEALSDMQNNNSNRNIGQVASCELFQVSIQHVSYINMSHRSTD